MKTKRIAVSKFTPVTLEVTFESEQEICNLWHRLNISSGPVNKATDIAHLKHDANDNRDLYPVINDLVQELKLKK